MGRLFFGQLPEMPWKNGDYPDGSVECQECKGTGWSSRVDKDEGESGHCEECNGRGFVYPQKEV